jgi:8-oxo-dGTP diphosphatase
MKIQLAGCVIADDYGRVLLLHRSTGDYSHWELPGGKIEREESPEQAAVREIQEELGVDVQLVKLLGDVEFEDNEREFHFTWFQAEITHGEPKVCEPETFDDLDYFELEDMLSLALSPNMQLLLPQLASGEVALD